VKPFARVFASMFSHDSLTPEEARRQSIHLEWDRQRARAVSASDLAEIDAIFARSL
jgi:hypothetical protein